MAAAPVVVAGGTPSAIVVAEIVEKRATAALVTGPDARLCGILTERDLLQKIAARGLDLEQCAVQDYMTALPETSKPDHPLGYAIQRMIVADLRYLPLVDESGRPVGIASSRDIIDYIATKFRVA